MVGGSQGISDTPAWIVSKANTYARLTGKTPFSIYQGRWSILKRDFERDVIPMALHEGAFLLLLSRREAEGLARGDKREADCHPGRRTGMALAPFGVLAHGRIFTDEEEERRRQTGENGAPLSSPASSLSC